MSERLFDLSGNVAVVIGGTGVLGGAVAEALAVSGAAVAIAGRNKERGNARCVAIRSCGGTAEYIATDASSRQSLRCVKGKRSLKTGTCHDPGQRCRRQRSACNRDSGKSLRGDFLAKLVLVL